MTSHRSRLALAVAIILVVRLAAAALPGQLVTFRVHVPTATPSVESVYLLLLPFQDWDFLDHIEMQPAEQGIMEATVSLPPNALVRYTYDRWDEVSWGEAWKSTRELSPTGIRIEHRLLQITEGMSVVEDVVSAWADIPSSVPTGILTGIVVDAASGDPLPDTNLSCSGLHIASDFDGRFRFPALSVGTHRVTAVRTLGDRVARTTSADIRAGGETSLRIEMQPAAPTVTRFEVQLPPDTPPNAEIRWGGNVSQLGARIGGRNSLPMPSINLPLLEREGDTAQVSLSLFEGMSMDYYYTIASDSHGREYDEEGRTTYRHALITADMPVIRDVVTAWRPPDASRLIVRVTSTEATPSDIPLAFRAGPSHWMTQVDSRTWETYLHGYPGQGQGFEILLGDRVFEAGQASHVARFEEQDSLLEIQIDAWDGAAINDVHWEGEAADIQPRLDDFVAGYYPPDYWWAGFMPLMPTTFDAAASSAGEWIAVSSIWSYGTTWPLPHIESRPLLADSVLTPREDIVAQIELAHDQGLKALLAPQFNMEMSSGGVHQVCADQPDAWWDAWLIEAEKFWLWNAQVAAEASADALMLPGQCFHVFPQRGSFHTEAAASRFDQAIQELVAKVRQIYAGKLLISGATTEFSFPGAADWVGVTTYDTGHPDLPSDATVAQWYAAYDKLFEETADPRYWAWLKPVVFYTIHVPSTATPDDPSGQAAQARQLEGLLQALADRPWVTGAFSWAYDVVAQPGHPQDGVRGRRAEQVLAAYYEAFTRAR